jgi:glucose/arabinose dehydrogenase
MGPMPLPRRRLVLLVMSVLVAACGAPDPTASPFGPSATPVASASPPISTGASPDASAASAPSSSPTPEPIADEPPPIAIEPLASGLSAPIGIATGPPGWLLVQEQAGRVIAIEIDSGATSVALDLTDRVLGGGERGLLGLALHPHWPDDARAFIHYSDLNGNTVLAEYRATDDGTGGAPVLDRASERVVLTAVQPFANHNGGQLAFGPDGYLWLGLGDGGSGGDPLGNGQDPSVLLGKVLRLDVDAGPGGDAAYAIPAGNPFADGGGAPEAYLLGLRNPWRFSFDRATGALWLADVGQNAFEEVNRLDPTRAAGANLGWNVMEASHCFGEAACSSEDLVLPVVEYGRDGGCSVTGGYVYRGTAVQGLAGWYLFGDYCSGLLFGIRSDVPQPGTGETAPGPQELLLETGARISSFGEDAEGELYVSDLRSGTIYRIVAGS